MDFCFSLISALKSHLDVNPLLRCQPKSHNYVYSNTKKVNKIFFTCKTLEHQCRDWFIRLHMRQYFILLDYSAEQMVPDLQDTLKLDVVWCLLMASKLIIGSKIHYGPFMFHIRVDCTSPPPEKLLLKMSNVSLSVHGVLLLFVSFKIRFYRTIEK